MVNASLAMIGSHLFVLKNRSFDRSIDFASVYRIASARVATEVKTVDNGSLASRTRAQTMAPAVQHRPPMVLHVNVY